MAQRENAKTNYDDDDDDADDHDDDHGDDDDGREKVALAGGRRPVCPEESSKQAKEQSNQNVPLHPRKWPSSAKLATQSENG